MRHFITIVFICSYPSLAAIAQEPASAPAALQPVATEVPPARSPAASPATTPAAESLAISDQEFLKIPGESAQAAQDVLIEQDLTLTGEIPEPAEIDSQYVDPNAIIPGQTAETLGSEPGLIAPSDEEQDRKLKITYREARTKAEKDATISSLREQAESASTFEGERAAYREYYRALFKMMKQLDKSLTKKCDTMEKAYLYRLAQNRIEPTIPLEPPPRPRPLAN
jgi:hypothetical protein